MRLPGHGIHGFVDAGTGLIVGAHPALFHDHLNFLAVTGRFQRQVAHPISFQDHNSLQLAGRHLLKVGGVIRTGKGIVTPTYRRHAAVKFAGPHTGCPFKHHVLGHVRHASHAIMFVNTADAIPNHLYSRRRTVIFAHHDPHAISQRGFKGVIRDGRRHRQRGCQQ